MIAEAYYGVPEEIEKEVRKFIPEDMLLVLDKFDFEYHLCNGYDFEVSDKKYYEAAISGTYVDAELLVRDINLPVEAISKYKKGMIIREKAFVDCTNKIGGIPTNVRYTIISNHVSDFSEMEEETNWNIHVAENSSRFRVIDVFEMNNKTLITLLHLPKDDRWKAFIDTTFGNDQEFIELARKSFIECINQECIPEVSGDDWLARCSFPIGMSSESFELTPVEKIPGELFYNINQSSFRDIHHKLLYIECDEWLDRILAEPETELDKFPKRNEVEAVIGYGYIDAQEGLSFIVFDFARIENDKIVTIPFPKDMRLISRIESLEKGRYFNLFEYIVDDRYVPMMQDINESYQTEDGTEFCRKYDWLDQFRDFCYPDDVKVLLIPYDGDDKKVEEVWVHCTGSTEHCLLGKLLNEPFGDFKVHEGDEIPFVPYNNEEHDIFVLISPDELRNKEIN